MESQHYDVFEANGNVASKQEDVSSHDTVTDMNLQNKPFEILRNLENTSYIYRRDVVRRKSDSEIGIVIQVHGDLDSDNSLSDSEDEDEDVDESGDELDDVIGSNYRNKNEENNGNSGKNARANSAENENEPSPIVLTANQVRVLLMDGSEIIETVNNVNVVDRGFVPGICVADASDTTGQVGIVVDVNINVDLLTHEGFVLKDKSSRDLKRIKNFTVGDYVVLGPWLGIVENVFDNVTVQFDDGSIYKVVRADPLHLTPIENNINEDEHCPYYPGQRVKASSSSILKNSRWLSGLSKANKVEGTVTKVTVGSVWIYWLTSAGYGVDSATAPDGVQSPRNLKVFSCFAHLDWRLGYWCLLPSSDCYASFDAGLVKQESNHYAMDEPEYTETGDESDLGLAIMDAKTGHTKFIGRSSEACARKNGETSKNSVSIEALSSSSGQPARGSIHELGPFHRKKIRKIASRKDKKGRKKFESFERALQIINIRTEVDVVWQNGKIERGLASASLVPISGPGYHEFVAEQYVVEKAADSDDAVGAKRVGVVHSVNANDRTACVRWLRPVSKADDPKEFDKEELMSVYELEGHPDFDHCYGDVVVRLSPVLVPAKMSSFEPSAEIALLSSSEDPENEESKHHAVENTDYSPAHEFSDLSWVGIITGLRDGDIEVTWGNGMISTVGPQSIYVVDRDDDESISDASDDAASWETVEDDGNSVDEEVGPQSIYVVDRDDDESISDASDDAASWETVEDDRNGVDEEVGPQSIFVVDRDDDESISDASDDAASSETVEVDRNSVDDEVGPKSIYVIDRDDDESISDACDDADSWETVEVDRNSVDEEVGPQSIYVVDRDVEESISDASDDAASWETVEDDRNSVDEEANHIDNDGCTMPENEDSNIVSTHSGIKSVDDFHLDEMPLNKSPDDACSEYPADTESKSPKLTTTCMDVGRDQSSDVFEMTEALCSLKTSESTASSRKNSGLIFKDFDIVRDPSDHHFFSSYGQNNVSRKWLKKVQQDWNILFQKNLPGDLYVRAFEDRMDLLRAVIVGAYGTPYQDGLFFFDFHLPPEYPEVPPSAYYHSGGWRINPNLYEEGKVCLSLLNTWTGRGNEVWDPSTSSILQLLVSLQGLVLNSKPYFNEAGYDKQVGTAEGEKNSLAYNENTYLLNCKTMMYLMRKPPKNFEDLIMEHFRKRGPYILRTCDAYMKGHMIGSLAKDVCVHDSNNTNANSLGFKQTLRKLVPKLFFTLSEVGANCQEFEHLATGQL